MLTITRAACSAKASSMHSSINKMRMHKLSYKNYYKVTLRWLWLAASFQKVRISALETDQEILFEGATYHLLWKISGAYMVKVYCNGLKTGTFLPVESPYVPLLPNGVILIKAAGVYRNRFDEVKLKVSVLNCRSASVAELNKPVVRQPHVIRFFQIKPRAVNPKSQLPLIRKPAIALETTTMLRSDEELFTRVAYANQN
jgi:hypothetical protein